MKEILKKKISKKTLIAFCGGLIAGAIGGFGWMTITSTPRAMYGSANINAMTLQKFNSNFTQYAGKHNSASQIRSLIVAIKSSNATDNEHYVQYTGPESSELSSQKSYTVECLYNDNTGYICEVIVTENEEANNVVENNIVDNDMVEIKTIEERDD